VLILHLAVCFIALVAGAVVLIALCRGRRQPTWDAVLLVSTALISLTGFPLASPPGTPTPDPARILGVMVLVIVVIAALAVYVGHLARAWRGIYIVAIVLAVYFNVFVGVTQAFLKIDFLHAFAPTGKEPPFLIAQLVTLALFVVIGVTAFKRYRGHTVNGMISRAASGA
jgi:divalent metal cation (Fe/Co/Zn/Cd) transporter